MILSLTVQCSNKSKVWQPKAHIIHRNLRKKCIWNKSVNFYLFFRMDIQRKSNYLIFSMLYFCLFLLNHNLWIVHVWLKGKEMTTQIIVKTILFLKIIIYLAYFGIKQFNFSDYLLTSKTTISSHESEGWGFCIFVNFRIKGLRLGIWACKAPTGLHGKNSFLYAQDTSCRWISISVLLVWRPLSHLPIADSPSSQHFWTAYCSCQPMFWQMSPPYIRTDAMVGLLAFNLLPIHIGNKISLRKWKFESFSLLDTLHSGLFMKYLCKITLGQWLK